MPKPPGSVFAVARLRGQRSLESLTAMRSHRPFQVSWIRGGPEPWRMALVISSETSSSAVWIIRCWRSGPPKPSTQSRTQCRAAVMLAVTAGKRVSQDGMVDSPFTRFLQRGWLWAAADRCSAQPVGAMCRVTHACPVNHLCLPGARQIPRRPSAGTSTAPARAG
ncbi:hypothetical protein SCANM63S_00807 [Streptomyces canarius]